MPPQRRGPCPSSRRLPWYWTTTSGGGVAIAANPPVLGNLVVSGSSHQRRSARLQLVGARHRLSSRISRPVTTSERTREPKQPSRLLKNKNMENLLLRR